jgi:hypothetical protein
VTKCERREIEEGERERERGREEGEREIKRNKEQKRKMTESYFCRWINWG